jgi:ketosteroid isomerase-like protein
MTETATYDLQVANNQSLDKGKYIVVWKQDNGTWKMNRDIFNSDMPPAPMAATK